MVAAMGLSGGRRWLRWQWVEGKRCVVVLEKVGHKENNGNKQHKKERRGQWIVNLRKKRVEHEVGKWKERKKSVGKKKEAKKCGNPKIMAER